MDFIDESRRMGRKEKSDERPRIHRAQDQKLSRRGKFQSPATHSSGTRIVPTLPKSNCLQISNSRKSLPTPTNFPTHRTPPLIRQCELVSQEPAATRKHASRSSTTPPMTLLRG